MSTTCLGTSCLQAPLILSIQPVTHFLNLINTAGPVIRNVEMTGAHESRFHIFPGRVWYLEMQCFSL